MKRYSIRVCDEGDGYVDAWMEESSDGDYSSVEEVDAELARLRAIEAAARVAMTMYELNHATQYRGVLVYEDGFKELKAKLEAKP